MQIKSLLLQLSVIVGRSHVGINPFTVSPKTVQEVQRIVRFANKNRLILHPLSTGMNWGYDIPKKNNRTLLRINLSRINKIIDFNEELGYVVVEPGVTFKQLYDFLRRKKSSLTVSTTGASMQASVMAGTLERGLGKGLYGKRNDFFSNLEIVLPTGEVMRSGLGAIPSALSQNVVREGVGPDLAGLFTQSSFGIVTKMTIWLATLPPYLQSFRYFLSARHSFKQLIDTIRELKREGLLPGNFLLANDYRMIANRQQYPWSAMKGMTPLSKSVLEKLKKKWKIYGEWYGEGVLYSSSLAEMRAKQTSIRAALSDYVTHLKFSSPVSRAQMKTYYSFISPSSGSPLSVPGVPTDAGLQCMCWRVKKSMVRPPEPVKDGCGIVWISPVVPFTGTHVSRAITLMKNVFIRFDFEPNFAVNCATERSLYIIAAILFDRKKPEEEKRAHRCSIEMVKTLLDCGYVPYRLSSLSWPLVSVSIQKSYRSFIDALKKTIDPQGVFRE